MENLVGKTILIGKEPGTANLLLSVKVNGVMKSKTLDMHVPQSVSRCFPEKDVAHCKIEVQDPQTIIIYNTKEPNKTFVDNNEILQKRIHPSSKVQLGADRFSLDVDKVLTSAIQLVKPIVPEGSNNISCGQANYVTGEQGNQSRQSCTNNQNNQDSQNRQSSQNHQGNNGCQSGSNSSKPTYTLTHLKPIWESYEKELEAINRQHDKITKVKQTIQRCIMIGGPAIAGAVQLADDNSVATKIAITLGVLVISMAFGFFITGRIKDPSEERRKQLEAKLRREYVCPNPQCGIPFGKQNPYDVISHKMKCGNCGCKYINNPSGE